MLPQKQNRHITETCLISLLKKAFGCQQTLSVSHFSNSLIAKGLLVEKPSVSNLAEEKSCTVLVKLYVEKRVVTLSTVQERPVKRHQLQKDHGVPWHESMLFIPTAGF